MMHNHQYQHQAQAKPQAKPEFKNKAASQAVANISVRLARIALILSTLSSAASFAFMLLALVPTEYRNTETYTGMGLYGFAFIVSGYVAYAIDFYGVQRFGSHALGELTSIASRKFYSSVMRKIYALLSLSVFVIMFSVSFFTSRDGSKMVAGMADIETTVTHKASKGVAEMREARKAALEPYVKQVEEVKKRMEREAALENSKYDLGKNKARAESHVIARYTAKGGPLYIAEEDLRAANERFDEQDKTLLGAIESDKTRIVDAVTAKANGITSLLGVLGIYPLFLAVALLWIDAVYTVSSQIKDDGQGAGLWDTITGLFGGAGKP